jgi:tetratricopeptide (TPR) repeat protein
MKSRTAEKNSEQLKQLFGKKPDSLLFSRIADLYRKEGNINRAIELCQKGLEVHPDYVTGRIILGRCYIENENYDNAIDEFTSVCKLDRKNLVAIKMLADVFVKRGETDKAGDLYRILTFLDPFDASFKILASRFDTTGKTELLDILGVQSVADADFSIAPSPVESHQSSVDFSGKQPVNDQISAGEDNLSGNSIDQMLSSFAEEEPVSSNDNDFRMNGSDIDDRMNTLFGEEVPAPSSSLLTGITEQQNLDSEISLMVPDDSSSVQSVSGSDISSRIDELFDSSGSNSSETTSPRGDVTEKIYLDKSFASELKQLRSEQLAIENTEDSEPEAAFSENTSESQTDNVNSVDDLTDSFSDKIVPFASNNSDSDLLSDEFEETLQFDRSMFSRLTDEPDYEELVSSSPFMEMGKADDSFLDQENEHVDNENHYVLNDDKDVSDNTAEHPELSPLDYLSQNVYSDEIDKNVQPDSQSGTVSENTELDGLGHSHTQSVEEDKQSEDENESGFINGEHFSDKLDSIFGENTESTDESSENLQMESSGFSLDDIDNSHDNEIADLENIVIDNHIAESPEFDAPELLADFVTDGIDESDGNNQIDYEIKPEDLNAEKIPDIDSSLMYSENDIIAESNKEEVQNSADGISQRFDIFDDLPATLETIRKSDVDKLRSLDQDVGTVESESEKPEILESNELIDENEIEQHAIVIENDSKVDTEDVNVIDADLSLTESITELSGIEDRLQIDDPILLVESGSHDIILDNDEGVVSDMDVLVVAPENEQMTGDDVADKIQDIFDLAESKEKRQFSVDESSLELVESSADGIINERTLPETPAIVELPDENVIIDDSEPSVNKPLTTDLVVDVEPEETMILIDDEVENSGGITGSDVEERIDVYFGNDILGDMSMNKLVPEDDESEETLIQDFYTLSGENTATSSGKENLDGVDEVEIDHTVDFVEEIQSIESNVVDEIAIKSESDALPEMLDEDAESTSQVESDTFIRESEIDETLAIEKPVDAVTDRFSAADLFSKEIEIEDADTPDTIKNSTISSADQLQSTELDIDQRDTSYNIPDHVLTPTLADIYFQQGQLQLALQIYSRLLEKEPDNDRIQGRIIEIKTSMEQYHEELLRPQNSQPDKVEKKPRIRAYPKEISSNADPRPLAGVRIPKKKKASRRDLKKKE